MKKLNFLILTLSMMIFADTIKYQVSIPVEKSIPVYKNKVIKKPIYEICRDNDSYNSGNSNVIGSIIGGAAGGILGHQIGKGSGKTAATIGGAVLGTIVGKEIAESSENKYNENCQKEYEYITQKELIGYKNYAYYDGKKIEKFSKKPLRNINLFINIHY